MNGSSAALLIAILLLAVILAWVRAILEQQDLFFDSNVLRLMENAEANVCPAEFVSRIFASEDREFISRLDSPELRRFFRRERNSVALLWIQQTSAASRRIMKQHLEASRRSKDLHFATEVKILAQYAEVRLLCGVLFISVDLVGPEKLRGLAVYAEELSQQLGHAQLELESVQ